MLKGEIVGRFTVGNKLFIDGKNSDGKDQHDQQRSDNGRGGESMFIGPHPKSPMIVRYEFRQEEHVEEEDRS